MKTTSVSVVKQHGEEGLDCKPLVLAVMADVGRRYGEALAVPANHEIVQRGVLAAAVAVEALIGDHDFLAQVQTNTKTWGWVQAQIKSRLPMIRKRQDLAFITVPTLLNAAIGQQGFAWHTTGWRDTRTIKLGRPSPAARSTAA